MKRVYIVKAIKLATFGAVEVTVPQSVIDLRGEKPAVVEAAWRKLLGQNDLGEDVDKKLPTRKEIMTLMLSRLVSERPDVYQTFFDSVSIHHIRNIHD